MTRTVTMPNGREWTLHSGVEVGRIENRGGRTKGSTNHSTARRNEAAAKGVVYVEQNGMKLKDAAKQCVDEFGLTITVEHMTRVIRQRRSSNT